VHGVAVGLQAPSDHEVPLQRQERHTPRVTKQTSRHVDLSLGQASHSRGPPPAADGSKLPGFRQAVAVASPRRCVARVETGSGSPEKSSNRRDGRPQPSVSSKQRCVVKKIYRRRDRSAHRSVSNTMTRNAFMPKYLQSGMFVPPMTPWRCDFAGISRRPMKRRADRMRRLKALFEVTLLMLWLVPASAFAQPQPVPAPAGSDGPTEQPGSPILCVPGKQDACACPAGASGVQRCNNQGTGFDPCDCANPVTPPPPPQAEAKPDVDLGSKAQPSAPQPQPPAPPAKRRRPGLGLIIGGSVVFGVTWITTSVASGIAAGVGAAAASVDGNPGCTESVGWGALPLFGPFIVAGEYPNYYKQTNYGGLANCADYTEVVTGVATVAGLVQFGGAAMLGAGIALAVSGSSDDASVAVGLSPAPGAYGLSVTFGRL
jgi:hypothetical protein